MDLQKCGISVLIPAFEGHFSFVCFIKDGMGYRVDFLAKEATEFPFEFDIVITE
ncbi:hypothetical protein [Anaerocolumna sp.]|uniref:hypothetical protein n=1 Tax=Anaerocolumna sp. TaxID=2041569 RepID=UPI0028B0A936|nr:hypothetical protein [Anaerocolumna sp.]